AELSDDVAGTDLAVLPGVGSARSAMNELRAQGLDAALRERLAEEKPVLGICLGLQLAVDWSEEDGGVDGLGLLPGKAVRVEARRVVKGVKFQGLRDVGDPVELGAAYSDRGADELVFLDVKATLEERDTLVGVVRRVAEQLAIPFTVGGGIRSVADADQLLSAGADKVSVNSAALARPSLVTELAKKLGSQAVVVAIDTEGGNVKTRAGTTETARTTIEWAKEAEARGAGEILLTSIDADGTREGYDLEITRAVADAVSVPVIASGGAGDASHVAAALEIAQGALLASILHEDPERLTSLREELRGMGV